MKTFLYSFISITLFSCYQAERNCKDFKTGTFEFTYTQDGNEKIGKFVRTQEYTIEYYDNKIDTSSVRWINDCEFITKKMHPSNSREQRAIHMKILKTSEDSYTFEYKYAVKEPNKKERVVKGIAKKID